MITLMSWGNKYGSPPANYKFDVSFFKNPWRDPLIKNEKNVTRRSKMVVDFMKEQEGCITFLEYLSLIIRHLSKEFPDEEIKIALCCSAGEYRSPAMVVILSGMLSKFHVKHNIIKSLESKV